MTSLTRRHVAIVAAALSACALHLPGLAQTAAPKYTPPSIEDVFQYPKLANVTLSRSGKYLAALARINGRMNVTVIDMETRKATAVTNFAEVDAISVTWVGDERLLFTLGKYGQASMGRDIYEGGGLFVVNRDGTGYRKLNGTIQQAIADNAAYKSMGLQRVIPGNNDEVIVFGNHTVRDAIDLYRLNLNTGKMSLLTMGRPAIQTASWLLDNNDVPRVVTGSIKHTLTNVVYYRAGVDSPWTEIARFEADKGPTLVPLAFESDNKTLQVAYNGGRDTMAVFRYDPQTKQVGELIAQHPQFDMGAAASGDDVPGAIYDRESSKIIGYRVNAEKPQTVWVDEAWGRTQAMLDAVLPRRINAFRRIPGSSKIMVSSYSDTSPLTWYVLDEAKRTMEELATSRPQLEGKLVTQHPFTYKSRDGLTFTGYYFLPPDYKPGTKLPTVLHIHGGPMARADSWGSGFGYLEGQLFASRGYAVVVPNYRITPGMGGKNYYAGFGSYGKQMLEDHEDAAKWAAEQGFTDLNRVCISGASYGGYAALMGPAKNPSFYKCAISGLAPTDMKYQLTSLDGDTALHEEGQTYWKRVIGSDDVDSDVFKNASPINFASRIKIPVLLYAGLDDYRVPVDQIKRMNQALISAGNPPKAFVAKPQEGHGFAKVENNVELYTQIFDFLDKYLKQ